MLASKSNYIDTVLRLLDNIPGIHSRAMFDGYGIYKDGTIFAIVVDNTLYYKVGEINKADYVKAKSKPFTYVNKGKEYAMSNWCVPKKILASPKLLATWTEKAVTASLLSKKPKRKS